MSEVKLKPGEARVVRNTTYRLFVGLSDGRTSDLGDVTKIAREQSKEIHPYDEPTNEVRLGDFFVDFKERADVPNTQLLVGIHETLLRLEESFWRANCMSIDGKPVEESLAEFREKRENNNE